MLHPIPCRWDGDAMVPVKGYAGKCDQQWVIGQVYAVDTEESRSKAAHNRYFATIHDIWKTLPDDLIARYPTSDHMRKSGLIATGYCMVKAFPFTSAAQMRALRPLLASIANEFTEYENQGATLLVKEPESQSHKAMGKTRFNASVTAVENWAAALVGATGDEARGVAS
jgi:hypothetical protein